MKAGTVSFVCIIMPQTLAITIYGSEKTIYKYRLTQRTPRFYGACLRFSCYLRHYGNIKMIFCVMANKAAQQQLFPLKQA